MFAQLYLYLFDTPEFKCVFVTLKEWPDCFGIRVSLSMPLEKERKKISECENVFGHGSLFKILALCLGFTLRLLSSSFVPWDIFST